MIIYKIRIPIKYFSRGFFILFFKLVLGAYFVVIILFNIDTPILIELR